MTTIPLALAGCTRGDPPGADEPAQSAAADADAITPAAAGDRACGGIEVRLSSPPGEPPVARFAGEAGGAQRESICLALPGREGGEFGVVSERRGVYTLEARCAGCPAGEAVERREGVQGTPGLEHRYRVEVRPGSQPAFALARLVATPGTVSTVPSRSGEDARLVVFVQDLEGTTRPPAYLLLVDPRGRRAGQDAAGRVHEEIPGAQVHPRDEHRGEESLELREAIDLRAPEDGEYRLVLSGTDEGAYALRVRGFPGVSGGDPTLHHLQPLRIAAGEVQRFRLRFDGAAGVTVLEREGD